MTTDRKILVFCSNPTNGGTPEMFTQFCVEMLSRNIQNVEFIPCIDSQNSVRVFSLIPDLKKLDVISENNLLGYLSPAPFMERVRRRVVRNIQYSKTKKRNIKKFRGIIRKYNIDSVLVHNGGYVGDDLCNQLIEAAYLEHVSGKRVIVFHNENGRGLLNRLRFFQYDRMVKKCATDIVCVSNYTKKIIEENTGLSNIKVIHNGISFDNTLTESEKKSIVHFQEADINLIMVGNFMENKGQLFLLEIFNKLLQETQRRIRLTIIGNVYDDDYFQQCSKYIIDNELSEKVTIVNNVYNAREYYDLFDITVFTSIGHESFPTVIIESMRCSRPIVAFDCAGVTEEMHDGVEGYIVQAKDTDSATNKLKKLVEDKNLRLTMGNNARKTYQENYARNIMGDKYLKLLDITKL